MTDFSASDLATIYPAPTPRVIAKARPEIDVHARKFIGMSPFCVLATASALGECDASPKGDPAGQLVHVIDDRTIALAERPGNKRAAIVAKSGGGRNAAGRPDVSAGPRRYIP